MTTAWLPSWTAVGVHCTSPLVGSIVIPVGAVGSEKVRMSPGSASVARAP